jgi:hypothetical protein
VLTEREIRKARREATQEVWLVRAVIAVVVIAVMAVLLWGIRQDAGADYGPADDPSFYAQEFSTER